MIKAQKAIEDAHRGYDSLMQEIAHEIKKGAESTQDHTRYLVRPVHMKNNNGNGKEHVSSNHSSRRNTNTAKKRGLSN
jgi:hypothetical protein